MKYLLLLTLLLPPFFGFTQQWLNKKYPSIQDKVQLKIPISSTKMKDEQKVYAFVYFIKQNNVNNSVLDIPLDIQKEHFTGEFTIPDSTIAIYTAIVSQDFYDHNDGNGWTSYVYKNKKEHPTAELYLIHTLYSYSDLWNKSSAPEKLEERVLTTFQKNNHLYNTNDLFAFYEIYHGLVTKKDPPFQKEILCKIYEDPQLDIEKLMRMETYFQELGLHSYVQDIQSKAEQIKPISIQKRTSMNTFFELEKLTDKKQLFDSLVNVVGVNVNEWKDLFSEMALMIAIELVEENKFSEALSYNRYFYDLAYHNHLYQLITNKITSDSFHVDINNPNMQLIIQTISQVGDEKNIHERTPYFNYFENKERIAYTYESRERNAAKIQYKLGNKDRAITILKGIEERGVYNYFYYGPLYFNYLFQEEKYAEAISLWQRMESKNFTDKKIKDSIERLVSSGIFKLVDYENAKMKIQENANNRIKKELNNHFTKREFQNFNLKDLDGNSYQLSDFRGKKLLVDFWATWCAPCISSFEDMYKLQNLFKDSNPDVQFIFILTLEDGDKEKTIEKAKKVLADKKVKFLVLFDDESKVSKSNLVFSLPTKFLVDQNGFMRYKSIGYSTNYEENLLLLKTAFELME